MTYYTITHGDRYIPDHLRITGRQPPEKPRGPMKGMTPFADEMREVKALEEAGLIMQPPKGPAYIGQQKARNRKKKAAEAKAIEKLKADEETEKLIAKKMALHEEIRQHFAKELEELAIESAGQIELFK